MENNFHRRKHVRLKQHNYDLPGAYFVTICTHNRQRILSKIVGAIHESPTVELQPYGEIVKKVIDSLPNHLGVIVDKCVIMPDHIHCIFVITRETMERAIRESPLRQRSIISKAVGYIKMTATKNIHTDFGNQDTVWQRSYYEHIIRNKNDYDQIVGYMVQNPIKWFYENKQ